MYIYNGVKKFGCIKNNGLTINIPNNPWSVEKFTQDKYYAGDIIPFTKDYSIDYNSDDKILWHEIETEDKIYYICDRILFSNISLEEIKKYFLGDIMVDDQPCNSVLITEKYFNDFILNNLNIVNLPYIDNMDHQFFWNDYEYTMTDNRSLTKNLITNNNMACYENGYRPFIIKIKENRRGFKKEVYINKEYPIYENYNTIIIKDDAVYPIGSGARVFISKDSNVWTDITRYYNKKIEFNLECNYGDKISFKYELYNTNLKDSNLNKIGVGIR